MGITTVRKLSDFIKKGRFELLFALIIPVLNDSLVVVISDLITESISDRLLFNILVASAPYIADKVVIKLAAS